MIPVLIYPNPIGAAEQPDLRPINRRQYVTAGNFRVGFETSGGFCTMRVPAGTITDVASIPRLLWGLLGLRPDGLHRAAALVHDQLCAREGQAAPITASSAEPVIWFPKLNSDETHALFRVMLEASGVPEWRAKLLWWAVRLFGPRWE